ncbi:hypothetical protein NDU88_006820 [Pleurodeles waltl]|uniref:Uncharacterized protein n=1 Tax=Pleurodeles waltl TaxID=8319 RepID=A0AAV7PM55_PLEWA|nr:hypothetical protein NDU88_006820 [Pleurodeles waltl]
MRARQWRLETMGELSDLPFKAGSAVVSDHLGLRGQIQAGACCVCCGRAESGAGAFAVWSGPGDIEVKCWLGALLHCWRRRGAAGGSSSGTGVSWLCAAWCHVPVPACWWRFSLVRSNRGGRLECWVGRIQALIPLDCWCYLGKPHGVAVPGRRAGGPPSR